MVGPLASSGLFAAKLGTTECGAFGSPEYFERKGMPQNYVELPRFDLLAVGTHDRAHKWVLHRGDDSVAVEFSPKLVCNDLTLLHHAVTCGLGIANLPAFLCKHDLVKGRLVEVLPGWRTEDMTFFALFEDPKAVPVRVRTLIDFLVDQFRRKLSWEIH